jgi:hypothetical protein
MLLLLRLLKVLGLDIPARLAELRTRVEHRVEQATAEAKNAIAAAAVTAVLAIVAAITAVAAIAIGFAALYRIVADSYGAQAGFGVVGGILLLITIILAAVVWTRSQPKPSRVRFPDDLGAPGARVAADRPDAFPAATPPPEAQPAAAAAPKPSSIVASAPVWLELLPVAVSLLAKSRAGGSLVDAVVASARGAKTGEARKAFDGAAKLVREGDRVQLLAAAGGAILIGWLMARRFTRNPPPE